MIEQLTTGGDLELASANGDLLRVRVGQWKDPFEEPLSEVNREYVETHGCWRKFDCCHADPYRKMIGSQIDAVELLYNEFADIAGVKISAGGVEMWFAVGGDECFVFWEQPDGFTLLAK